MEPLKINVFTWKTTIAEKTLVSKIIAALKAKVNNHLNATCDFLPIITDLSVTTVAQNIEAPSISFGLMASRQYQTTGPRWDLPTLSKLQVAPENMETRQELARTLEVIAEALTQVFLTENDGTSSHVEMADGVTVGQKDTDIQISETEIQYLRQLKELLGGSKIIITKGETTIEVS